MDAEEAVRGSLDRATGRIIPFPPENLADGFGHWLAGFVDGEGCFFIHPGEHRPYLDVCLRDDDGGVLNEAKMRTGVGAIYRSANGGNRGPQIHWRVGRAADTLRLVGVFDAYPLRAKKRQQYVLWRRAVLISPPNVGRGYRVSFPPEMEEIAGILRSAKRYWSPTTASGLRLNEKSKK